MKTVGQMVRIVLLQKKQFGPCSRGYGYKHMLQMCCGASQHVDGLGLSLCIVFDLARRTWDDSFLHSFVAM